MRRIGFRTMMLGALALVSVAAPAAARDYFVTPEGAGAKDGTQWSAAMSQDALVDLLAKTVDPGDRVVLGSGEYTRRPKGASMLAVARGGALQKPVTIEGVDTGHGLPRIVGRWSHTNVKYHAHSWSAISLAEGVSHVRLANLRVESWMHGLTTGGGHAGLAIESVHVERCREAVVLVGASASIIRGCRLSRYTKKGVAVDRDCVDLRVIDTTADATGGDADWPTEVFPFGFVIADAPGNRDITYERCVARNNLHVGEPNEYWNGDGFVAEAPASGVRYIDCIATDNSDAGFDDKSKASVFEGCVAARNKRNFRVWNKNGTADEPSRMTRCVGAYAVRRGGRSDFVGLWVGGAVVAERCTFHANPDAAVSIAEHGSLIARRCLFTAADADFDAKLVKREGGAEYTAESVVEWPGEGVEPPRYRAASSDWSGRPLDAMVSERYAPQIGIVADGE